MSGSECLRSKSIFLWETILYFQNMWVVQICFLFLWSSFAWLIPPTKLSVTTGGQRTGKWNADTVPWVFITDLLCTSTIKVPPKFLLLKNQLLRRLQCTDHASIFLWRCRILIFPLFISINPSFHCRDEELISRDLQCTNVS